jgi:hypothetical protein
VAGASLDLHHRLGGDGKAGVERHKAPKQISTFFAQLPVFDEPEDRPSILIGPEARAPGQDVEEVFLAIIAIDGDRSNLLHLVDLEHRLFLSVPGVSQLLGWPDPLQFE